MDVLLIEAVIYFIMDILMVEYDKVHMHVILIRIYFSIRLCRESILQCCVENQVYTLVSPHAMYAFMNNLLFDSEKSEDEMISEDEMTLTTQVLTTQQSVLPQLTLGRISYTCIECGMLQ